jgi:hypothetical protein
VSLSWVHCDLIRTLVRLTCTTVARSERGVVFFRDAVLSPEEQVILVDKLGKLGGKPSDSTLHIHPLTLKGSAYGDEISVISNEFVFDSKFSRPKRVRVKGDTLWVSVGREVMFARGRRRY